MPGQSFKCFRPIYMVDDILGLPLKTLVPTIFSSPSYLSGSPSNNLGRPYPCDQLFECQRDPIPWNFALPWSEDEVDSTEMPMAAEDPAPVVSILLQYRLLLLHPQLS